MLDLICFSLDADMDGSLGASDLSQPAAAGLVAAAGIDISEAGNTPGTSIKLAESPGSSCTILYWYITIPLLYYYTPGTSIKLVESPGSNGGLGRTWKGHARSYWWLWYGRVPNVLFSNMFGVDVALYQSTNYDIRFH